MEQNRSIYWGRALLTAVLFLVGCVFPDLNPRHYDWIGFFYATCDTNDVVSADFLIGKWKSADQKDESILEFGQGGTDFFGVPSKRFPKPNSESDSSVMIHTKADTAEAYSYCISVVEDSTAIIIADLLPYRIENTLLADIAPYQINLDRGLLSSLYSIPSHTIWRIEVMTDTLYVSTLDGRWLGEVLKNDPKLLAHEVNSHGNILITAPTDRIQAFLASHASSMQFTHAVPWHRIAE